MSTQQVGAALGFAVGAYLGYPQLGLVAGSLVGGALTPKQRGEGPRLDDLKVTVSTYGAGIPTIYGTARLGGNVIFSTDKIEIPTTTSTGKGGGAENTTYQAFVHMAVALCYGEIQGIRKMWKDGKLIYDSSRGQSIEASIASASSPFSRLTVYTGTETQLPDPVQQIYLGLGNAPPYRGIAYVQMNAVECPGGHIPQFSFEVVQEGSVTPTLQYGTDGLLPAFYFLSFSRVPIADPTFLFLEQDDSTTGLRRKRIDLYALAIDYASPLGSLMTDLAYNYTRITGSGDIDALVVREVPALTSVDSGNNRVYLADGTYKTFTPGFRSYGQSTSRWAKWGNRFMLTGDAGQGANDAAVFDWDSGLLLNTAPAVSAISALLTDNYAWFEVTAGIQIRDIETFSLISTTALPVAMTGHALYFCPEQGDRLMCFANGSSTCSVWELTVAGSAVVFALKESAPFTVIDVASGAVTFSYANGVLVGVAQGATSVDRRIFVIRFRPLDIEAVNVADIITAQCLRAGLTAGQIDVSTIEDTVHGYTIANPASSRANLEPLMSAYGIFATEEDGKIRFKKLADVASVVTIPYAELGAVEGSAVPGDPMPLTHEQEAELPRSVTVKYIHPDFDYQTAAEPAPRQMTESTLDTVVDLPIATNANHAATVAQRLLYIAWNERNKRSFTVGRKYAAVSAGDGVTFALSDGALQRWRITKVVDTGTLCEWEGVPADESIYTQTAIGAPGYDGQGQQVAPLAPPTRTQLLDIPMLRDVDNDAGPYVALAGYASSGWTGAELFVGDDATNLEARGTVDTSATIGFAETVLGGWAYANVDESNLLTVNVGNAELSSTTRAGLLAGAANAFAIGGHGRWEVAQFQRAESLGNGRYTLSGLRRGLRGTERNTGHHAVGDTFVLLVVAGLLKPSMDVGAIGQTKSYRAVSKGRRLSSGTSQRFAGTGEPLMPYSPVNARRTSAGNDITLSWSRRTRFTDNVLAGIFPLGVGDAPEAYEIDFFTSSAFTTLAGTLVSNTSSVLISSAQQTAMGLTPGGTLYVRVFQMAGRVGRGHSLQATI